jgi:hypothetical protein
MLRLALVGLVLSTGVVARLTSEQLLYPSVPAVAPPPKPPCPAPPGGGHLLGSGGPKYGPVPLMLHGLCSVAFPSRRGNLCYR